MNRAGSSLVGIFRTKRNYKSPAPRWRSRNLASKVLSSGVLAFSAFATWIIVTNTAVPFLAEVGEVKNFTSSKKLIAFAGLDPSIHQSGKFLGSSKLSKRGNRHLRRAIYLMTTSVVSQNAFFRAYFMKRKREGLPPQKALFAVAHKPLRVIFAMLSNRTYFNAKEAI
jgi:hypothetical protein